MKELIEYLYYNKDTGEFKWIKSPSKYKPFKGRQAGTLSNKGKYKVIRFKGINYLCHRLAWYFIYRYTPENIDHINGNGLDNRIINLRDVAIIDNAKNTKIRIDNTSGVVGVRFNKLTNKYEAYISHNKKKIHLGLFNTIEEAVIARDMASIEYGYHENHGKR